MINHWKWFVYLAKNVNMEIVLLGFQVQHNFEVVTLSHTLLGSPQGVPKESMWTSPSITLVLPDSKDSPRTPKESPRSPKDSPRTLYGVLEESLRTSCIILIKRVLFRESLYSPAGTDQGLRKDSVIILINKK